MLCLFTIVSGCNSESLKSSIVDPKPSIVDPKLAEYAASQYYTKFLTGENRNNPSAYEYVGYETMYDLDGMPRAYIFIYKQKGSDGNSLDELKQISWDIEAEAGPTKYQLFGIQTAITSAVNTEDVLIRSYGGLPEVMVKEPEIKEFVNENYPKYELGRIIFINAMEIYYEAATPGDIDAKPLAGDSILIEQKRLETTKVSELQKLQKEREEQTEKGLKSLSQENRKLLEEGMIKRKESNIAKWKEFEEEFSQS